MTSTKDIFASRYITADRDLIVNGSPAQVHLQIAGYEVVQMGDENKHTLTFSNYDKGLVLNKTNFNTLMKIHPAQDTNEWVGKWITVRAQEVEFKGEMVWGTRIALTVPNAEAIARAQANIPGDDEIPF